MSMKNKEIEQTANLYYNDIYKFCVSRCGNKTDGEDIAQSVFLLLIEKSGKLENSNIRAWLYQVADLKIKEYFRQKKLDDRFIKYEDCADFVDESDVEESLVENFEELLSSTQKKILDILSDNEKVIFIKRFIEKKSIKLIADEIKATEANVRVQTHRVKNKAKEVITTTELLINIIIFKFF
ncbi:MAG: RNA polymerase sigma factor [Acutalibacteraceae bacterium]